MGAVASLVLATSAVMGAGTAHASERSSTCQFLDEWELPPTTVSVGAAFSTGLAPGEILEVSVEGTTDGNRLTLEIGPVGARDTVLNASAVDGRAAVRYVASGGESNFFVFQVGRDLGAGVLDLTCTAPPPDSDGDGVLDVDDRCPGTDLAKEVTPRVPAHFGADVSGAFVDGRGNAAGITIVDTGGCTARQIAETSDLPPGLSRVVLRLGIPAFLLDDAVEQAN